MIIQTTLALNRELSQGDVRSNDAICGSQPMVTSVINNKISETSNPKEVKSKKVCRFVQFSNEMRTCNVSLRHISKGLMSMRELWTEHKHGLNGRELLIELELRAKVSWRKDNKNCGATA